MNHETLQALYQLDVQEVGEEEAAIMDSLEYNKDTGIVCWKKRVKFGRMNAGDAAGTVEKKGYLAIRVAGKKHKAHRVAWLLHYGKFPDKHIDHIDGNKTNNAINNLRLATNSENKENLKGPTATNKVGFLGVYFMRSTNKFAASIKKDGKNNYLGCYETPEEAHSVYLEAKSRLHSFSTI